MISKFWSRFVRPSTRAFIAEARQTPNYSFGEWLHGYVYARWPYLYIGLGTGEHPWSGRLAPIASELLRILGISITKTSRDTPSAFEKPSLADTYHGKVVPLKAAKELVTVNEDITITNLEKIIPYARARDIILRNPHHIVALECPCRSVRPKPCLPLDVCLIVGEPMAGFVAEHHPARSRWISQDEAVEILQAEHERGHVHHAFFKDAMLGRFYAICNCCSCCCGAMQAQRNNVPMLASSGYICQVDGTLCEGCGTCVEYCPFDALFVNQNCAVVDVEHCMGCGVCVSKCRQGAIALIRDAQKSEPLEIRELMAQIV
jgi:ferredoxin